MKRFSIIIILIIIPSVHCRLLVRYGTGVDGAYRETSPGDTSRSRACRRPAQRESGRPPAAAAATAASSRAFCRREYDGRRRRRQTQAESFARGR